MENSHGEVNSSSASQISAHFMELQGSLLYSQEPAICPYPQPD